ncbi:hypothetical protein G9A89_002380 [Geosiphon pyriformis]|nr:hypothetical protein G9A89_002380 [Geosiphon pyriformis]
MPREAKIYEKDIAPEKNLAPENKPVPEKNKGTTRKEELLATWTQVLPPKETGQMMVLQKA